jgi:ribosomal-protein-alanine N-acetyltransferase
VEFLVESERLLARAWRPEDRPALERMAFDAAMMRYITAGRSLRPEEVDAMLLRQEQYLAAHGCCMGAMVHKPRAEVIGVAGIQPLDIPGEFELGWWVWKDFWGQGFATEMARALVAYARDVMKLPRVVAVIDPPNAASIRVAEKIGMRFECLRSARETAARREDVPVACYSMEL